MSRELYQLLVRTKRQAEEHQKRIKDIWTNLLKTELPPRYYELKGLIVFCDFFLNNEEIEDENNKSTI